MSEFQNLLDRLIAKIGPDPILMYLKQRDVSPPPPQPRRLDHGPDHSGLTE